MKCKAILLIAALILTPMTAIISTTTVSTPSVFGATDFGTCTVSLTPTSTKAGTKILFTVVITNNSTERIDNVRIIGPSVASGYAFSNPIGRFDNVAIGADNIRENAIPLLKDAGENLKLAGENVKASGVYFRNAAENFGLITTSTWLYDENDAASSSARDNTKSFFGLIRDELANVGNAIDNAVENWDYIKTHLRLVDNYMQRISGFEAYGYFFCIRETFENVNSDAAKNLWVASEFLENVLRITERAIDIGNLENLGENLKRAGVSIYAAGTACTVSTNLRDSLRNVGTNLQTAGQEFVDASNFIDNAASALALADNYIKTGADNIRGSLLTTAVGVYPDTLRQGGDNLLDFENALENAVINLPTTFTYEHIKTGNISDSESEAAGGYDNLFRAGENLKRASTRLALAALNLGVALGSDEENAASVNLDDAGDNLKENQTDLVTAGTQLVAMANNLSAAMAKMKATMQTLGPENWSLTSITDGVQFEGQWRSATDVENIAAGVSKTFSFIWTTPTTAAEVDTLIGVLVNKGEPNYTTFENLNLTTTVPLVRIDGKKPSLNIVVTQSGVGVENVVGDTLDNAHATITITANEALNLIANPDESVVVENGGTNVAGLGRKENLLPPIAFDATNFTMTSDNKVWTLVTPITVGAWDDNYVRVRVTKTQDSAGNVVVDDNNATVDNLQSGRILVDTRAPVFFDNGVGTVTGILVGMRTGVTQARTPTGAVVIYRYVDNKNNDNLVIIVNDNTYWGADYLSILNTDNDIYVTSVTVDGVAALRDPTQENRWTLSLTLSDGYHSVVTVTATDRCGNSKTENAENIFIDTKTPTITFDTITRTSGAITWHENSFVTDDNKPTIKLTILDQGGITTGLGVQYENMMVYLTDNKDNIYQLPLYNGDNFIYKLENTATFDPATGVFENTYENYVAGVAKGLSGGTYWVVVMAADNLSHGTYFPSATNMDNQWIIAMQSFVIDLTAPSTTSVATLAASTSNPLLGTTSGHPLVQISTSLSLTGSGAEAGATLKVYLNDSTTEATSTTVGTDGRWTVTITVTAGASTKVELTLTDTAGNESPRQLFGFVLADGTAPAVTISSPATAASTDKASIAVTGTIGKDTWETYNAGTMSVTATTQVGSATAGGLTIGSDGSFTVTATLSEGPNSVTIMARDSAGNVDSETVTVERTVTPWATYAIVVVIVALILAAIAIFRKK
jgi:hypothetical protein